MRFGTVPIVSRVGGLVETVVGYDDRQGDSPHQATGIVIDGPTVASLCHAITPACRLYREPIGWRRMQAQAMRWDFSWIRPAERYLSVFADLIGAGGRGDASLRRAAVPAQLRLTAS